ncbi:hypothetical protein GCM10010270_81040 [Streptomyces violaceus]|nr:hypothetical protein GCM10010270_81040 [Streptomyces janthinus]
MAETLNTGVIFTVENRVSLSEGGYPRVLLAIVGTFVEVECRPDLAPGVTSTRTTAGSDLFVL